MLTLVAEEAGLVSLDAYRNASAGAVEAELLATVPAVIAYYSDGSSALAADYYADERAAQATAGRYAAVPFVVDRAEKIRRGVIWAVKEDTESRLLTVVEAEVRRPYRDTIMLNRRADPKCVGYRRIARGESCQFCLMLADKGAIFKEDTAYFAAHDRCRCTAQPCFLGGIKGPEADVMQYVASGRKRTVAEKAKLRDYLNMYFPR